MDPVATVAPHEPRAVNVGWRHPLGGTPARLARVDRRILAALAATALAVAALAAFERPAVTGEPTVRLMALSLAADGDLLFAAEDRARAEPSARVTLMSDDGFRTSYLGKPFLYPALAAPAVAVAGDAGFAMLNLVLLLGSVAVAARHLRRHQPGGSGPAFAALFFVASGTALTALGPSPLALEHLLLTLALALATAAAGAMGAAGSGVCLALAAFQMPAAAVLLPPLVALRPAGRRLRDGAAVVVACGLALAGIGLVSYAWTGALTPYLGESRRFVAAARTGLAAPPVAGVVPPVLGSWDPVLRLPPLEPRRTLQDVGYLLGGRHLGFLPRCPLAVVALALFLVHGRRSVPRWVLLAAVAATALLLAASLPDGFDGDDPRVGNRYLATLYPAFLFLVTTVRPRALAAGGALALAFLLPLAAGGRHPGGPFALLPVEWPHLPRIAGHAGSLAHGVDIRARRADVELAGDQVKLRPAAATDLWLSSERPLDELVFEVRGPGPAVVSLDLDGDRKRVDLDGTAATARTVRLRPRAPARERVEARDRRQGRRLRVAVVEKGRPSGPVTLVYAGTGAEIGADLYHVAWRPAVVPDCAFAGQSFEVVARFTNASPHPWPGTGAYAVSLGHSWHDAEGAVVIRGGARSIESDVPPGATAVVRQKVTAPSLPGRYTLVLDPVYDRVAWFSSRNPDAAYEADVWIDADPATAANGEPR